MERLNTKEDCLKRIEELNLLYKTKSHELVLCTSLSKELKIKEEMSRYEVQSKVAKRKLVSLEQEDSVSV